MAMVMSLTNSPPPLIHFGLTALRNGLGLFIDSWNCYAFVHIWSSPQNVTVDVARSCCVHCELMSWMCAFQNCIPQKLQCRKKWSESLTFSRKLDCPMVRTYWCEHLLTYAGWDGCVIYCTICCFQEKGWRKEPLADYLTQWIRAFLGLFVNLYISWTHLYTFHLSKLPFYLQEMETYSVLGHIQCIWLFVE